jgi:hypothetical protein
MITAVARLVFCVIGVHLRSSAAQSLVLLPEKKSRKTFMAADER